MIVYSIKSKLDFKIYVGKTDDGDKRWKQHKTNVLNNSNSCPVLYSAMRKYGIDNFIFEIIEKDIPKELINLYENFYICLNKSYKKAYGYNCTMGGDGCTHNKESKLKISNSRKGIVFTESHLQNLSKSHIGLNLGNLNPGAIWSYVFLSPDFEEVETDCLNTLCVDNNLSPSKMCLIASRKRVHHKGWTFISKQRKD